MNTPKERIIDTASILFHQQGYNSTGINQIIKEANVAKASFYQHFKSKDDLCLAFLNARHEYWFSELISYVSEFESTKKRILNAFEFIIYMNSKEDFRGCSFLNILSEISKEQGNILTIIQAHKYDLREFFAKELGDELLAAHIYLLFESSIIESQLFKSNEIVEKSKQIVNSLI
ncbi:TetR/AcrR family transcriptional regulator [Dyadobacter chenwenxiniae]|uniref:TetR/AcrR family transcriptional regulator n=1 Tax=Dyadobacter chenwenxiniae TaxID=2906456 RepID=A0A9X1TH62_9BACT|nr:TetR/AcrR family transcriptional regulator [Dyadobacter chenwenxiniae]MCF0064782.1 TetR/AcrR family transcriptional regulator [Dyadobacter chenwenxiniae]UON84162.1 TetR/AcrR family transcriptional regulator [Dyadobacter chenwenxiniae]